MVKIGLHLKIDKSLNDTLNYANNLGIEIVQLLVRGDKFSKNQVELKGNIWIYAHGIYNLSKEFNSKETNLALKDILMAEKIGAKGIIFHVGDFDIINIEKSINYFLSKTKSIDLIVENSVSTKPDQFALIFERFESNTRVKYCVDSCHAYVSGFESSFFVEKSIGWKNLELVHLNDSRNNFGSKVDGHSEISFGKMKESDLKEFAKNAWQNDIPIVLETNEKIISFEKQINYVKDWLE